MATLPAGDLSSSASTEQKAQAERSRLNEQHQIVTIGLGHLLSPLINDVLINEGKSDSTLRIADVACGSGVWLTETVRELKCTRQTTGDGFDISAIHFPKGEKDQDRDVHFHTLDITSPHAVPSEFQGVFDVVAVRFLHIWLQSEHWDVVMANLVSFVKPGGHLTWTDWDPRTVRVAATQPGAHDAATRALLQRYTAALAARRVGPALALPPRLVAAGLEVLDSDLFPVPPSFEFTRNVVDGVVGYLREVGEAVGPEEEREVREEVEARGSLLWYDLWCHVARKAA